MTPLRRHLITAPAALVLLHATMASSRAQSDLPGEGKAWRRVTGASRPDLPAGKIEVVEFFWYGCPHCYQFDPMLQQWVAQLPDDVVFRRVHVPFQERKHQQLYYTLLAMGRADELNGKVFRAMHEERRHLASDREIVDWAVAQGLDRKAFSDQFKSFGVRTAMTRATREMNDWGVDSVPMIGVDGKYLTAPAMAGSNRAVLELVDRMIASERAAAKQS